MNIAIIPARGGSKRIPRKNIKEFCGIPIIGYAINAAKKSGLFEHVIVSTDDQEIAEIAKTFGAEIPFIRSAELSVDHISTIPVIAHAIQTCINLGWNFNLACCIYPCSPFIRLEDIKESFLKLNISEADYCFSIAEYSSAIQRSLKLLNSEITEPYFPEFQLIRTQDLPPAYFDAGQFYWGKVEAWLNNKSIHNGGLAYLIPNWRAIDIDTQLDWKRAELMYAAASSHK